VNGLRPGSTLLAAIALTLGCYNPKIADGSFTCGDHGECPDTFHCAPNHRCYRGDGGNLVVDTGVDMMCIAAFTTQPVPGCTAGPVGAGSCNPACQTDCNNCGWCGVVAGVSKCLTVAEGSNDVGQPCDLTKENDCKAGQYCQPECGGSTGRCYAFCSAEAPCAMGTCIVNAKGTGGGLLPGLTLCSLVVSCDVVAKTGCPSGFACYPVTTTQNECDCAGTANTGDPCIPSSDCVAGDFCVGPKGGATCHQTCATGVPCPTGTSCNAFAPTYGYCM
jgi:hypothetical protein